MKKLKAFTLVELLVVIAIISILATVVIANLGANSRKAWETNALESARSAQAVVIGCLQDYDILSYRGDGATATPICSGSDTWPNIKKTGYTWKVGGVDPTAVAIFKSSIDFTYQVVETKEGVETIKVTCDQQGCFMGATR